MIRKIVLPILALAGVVLAIYAVITGGRATPPAPPVAPPATAPFDSYIAGAGLVEAASENIAVGTPIAGVVIQVLAEVGGVVQSGQPLFTLDDRDLRAQLAVRRTTVRTARERLARLRTLPRPEEIPPAQARVNEAQAALEDAKRLLAMWQRIEDPSAVSREEMAARRFAVARAEAQLQQAQAELALLEAGSWQPDIEIAQAELEQAEAQVRSIEVEIDRLTVRSPIDATVLQVKIRPGEFAPAGIVSPPLMLLGDTSKLHVRVDVDEHDAWRVRPGSPAVAFVRGNRQLSAPLEFVRVEPYVIPKRSLTGEATERVDTRVLQLLYSFDPQTLPVYVGQQVDVFIDAPPVRAR